MISERNEKGQIQKAGLSSERATELANKRWAKERKNLLEELLLAYGFSSVEATPPDIRTLAEKALSSKSGSVSALIQLMKLRPTCRVASDGGVRWDPQTEACPTCGHIGEGVIGIPFARWMVKIGREYEKEPDLFAQIASDYLDRLQDVDTGEHTETQ